jgi:hypothetical protein
MKITRLELYNKVWNSPLSKLCQGFGLSDNGLRKICVRNNIPIPKAGYWAKIYAGHNVPKNKFKGEPNREIEIQGTIKDQEYKSKRANKEITNKISSITFDPNLIAPLPMTKKFINSLRENLIHHRKSIKLGKSWVSPKNTQRAILIYNNIATAVEQLGGKASLGTDGINMQIWDREIKTALAEKFIQANRRKGKDHWGYEKILFEYQNTGLFSFHILGNGYWRNPVKSFNEGRKQSVESLFPKILLGMYEFIEDEKEKELKDKHKKLQDASYKRQLLLEEEQRVINKEKREQLYKNFENWKKAKELKEYASDLIKQAKQNPKSIKDIKKFHLYIKSILMEINSLQKYH